MSDIKHFHNPITNYDPADEWRRAFVLWLTDFPSRHTREAYQRAWHNLEEYTNRMHPDLIEHEHIRAWKIYLTKKQLSKPTVHQKMCAISSFYKFVNNNYPQLRRDNPCDGVTRPTIKPYGKSTYLHGDNDKLLLKSIDTSTIVGARDYAIIRFLLTSAVRVSVIADANIGDISRQREQSIFTFTNKGGNPTSKKLAIGTLNAINNYLDFREDERDRGAPLFKHKNRRVNPRRIQLMVKARCNKVFGEGHNITPHSLRHTAAMQAIPNASILEVRDLLDHSNIRVTSVYLEHQIGEGGANLSRLLDKRYD